MSELHMAQATVKTTDKLLKWGAVTFAVAAIGWGAHQTASDAENKAVAASTGQAIQHLTAAFDRLAKDHAEVNAKQDARLSDLEKALAQMIGAQSSEQLSRLFTAVSQQGERLARIEARLEGK